MRYVPFGNGAQFEMAIKNDTAKSGAPFCLLEVKTPYEVCLLYTSTRIDKLHQVVQQTPRAECRTRQTVIGKKSYNRLLKKPMAEYLAQDSCALPANYGRLILSLIHIYKPHPHCRTTPYSYLSLW